MNIDIESLKQLRTEYLNNAKTALTLNNNDEYKAYMRKYYNINNKLSYIRNGETMKERNKQYMKSYLSNDDNKEKHKQLMKINSKKYYDEYKAFKTDLMRHPYIVAT